MQKSKLYKEFIKRLEVAYNKQQYFQAVWYAYAVLEDRLISMLANSGGVAYRNGQPIRMLGNKLKVLKERVEADSLLKANLDHIAISEWAGRRNTLIHGMADGSLSLTEIDSMARETAEDGVRLCREVCAAAMRLKRHRSKI